MFSKLCLLALLGLAIDAEEVKNPKRSLNTLALHSWPSILGYPSSYPSAILWHPNSLGQGAFHSISSAFPGKASHYSLAVATTTDIAAAMAAAKEATAAAALAHQKVQAAREQVFIQERLAAAKEAAAHAAIQRSEAAAQVAAAIQRSEALAAAAAVVQKSAVASAASVAAAHAAGNFNSEPWTSSKAGYIHWS